MVFYTLDYTIEKVSQQNQTAAQKFLQKFTDKKFGKSEAEFLVEKIADHKWYVSERLNRDIGFNAAAVDYLENFYEARRNENRRQPSRKALQAYEDILLTM